MRDEQSDCKAVQASDGRYSGQDRRRQITYKDAILEYPQLRSLPQLIKQKRWTNEELVELNELQAIVKFQSEDCTIFMRRLRYLCGKYNVRELPIVMPDRRNTLKEAGKKVEQQQLVSGVYFSPYVSKRKA